MSTLAAAPSEAPGHSIPAARHRWLERAYARFHRPVYLDSDPLQRLHRYDGPADREAVGLVAASLAYGNVTAILGGIDEALRRLGPSPAAALDGRSARSLRAGFGGFRYRVTSSRDMAGLLVGAKRLRERHGSLGAALTACDEPAEPTLLPALGRFIDALCHAADRRLYHLLPHPDRGSACKRPLLYLRWMVRRDAIDPGGWDRLGAHRLIAPIDTHMHRVAGRLGLTRRKQPNLKAAVEITEALRSVRPDDPLRYDFALTRPGILRLAGGDPHGGT